MKTNFYVLVILILITSCKASTPEYNSETIYLIVQSPKYDLYLSKNDMTNILEKKHIKSKGKINYDCIKQLSQTDSIKVSSDYNCTFEINKETIEEYIARYDAFYFSSIDLFKKHKVLVYDKIQNKWISNYKIKHRIYKPVDEISDFHEVLYNDSLIYDRQNTEF